MNQSKLFGKNNENLFQSKSAMLKLLQNNLKQSKIEKIYDFTVQEWLDNQKFILKNILDQKIQILYAGILSGGIAFVFQIYAQKNISPAPAAIIFSLEGVFATIAAWIILSQILNFNNILGCSFILVGVLISQLLPVIRASKHKQ